MKLTKAVLIILLMVFTTIGFSKDETININFKNLKISDLVKITSKILKKNILITTEIKGKVDFVSNKPIKKSDIIKVLMYVLQAKGYTIVDNDDILRIVRINDTSKYNVPILNKNKNKQYFQMITKVFRVDYSNVDYIASKIRHLISKSAKLVTDKESNSIVITDFPSNIKTIENIVKLITEDTKKYIQIVKLKNMDVTIATANLKEVSKTLYNQKVEKEKVSIIASKDDNSVMIIGKKKNVDYLKNYIKRIDKKDSLLKRVVEVINLKNVESKNVIKIIDTIIGKKKYKDPSLKPFSAVDEETNSIILSGPSDEIEYIKLLISKLDKEKLQVYVQARIIEVNEGLTNNIGIKYGIQGGIANSGGLNTFASSLNGGASIAIDTATFGLDVPTLKSGLALGATINLLKENYALDIVSEPSILCINNIECSIYVGETISIKTASSTTDGGVTSDSYKREDIGLKLKVKPRISNDNKVTLEIEAILEGVKTTVSTSGNPDTSKKEVKTTAIVYNGEAVILGGLIENKIESTKSKVPLLGDIPLIGGLFRNTSEDSVQKNLVIVVTPYIIPQSRDLSYVREQLMELKKLENKYTKDFELRLLEKKLTAENEDKKRENKVEDILDDLEDNKEDAKEDLLDEDKQRYKKIQEEHMKIIFGESSGN